MATKNKNNRVIKNSAPFENYQQRETGLQVYQFGNSSENHFQRELKDPWVERAADDTEAGAIDRGAGRAEIGMIQHIEELAAELQPLSLGYRESLEQRVVQIHIAGRPQLPAARRADCPDGIGGEYAGVKPARDLLLLGPIRR
jgi:hypothetical protein